MIDGKDKKILDIIQKNPKKSISEIAELSGISSSSVHDRIKKLETNQIITNYSVTINHEKIGIGITAFVRLEMSTTNWSDDLNHFLMKHPWIYEIHEIIGEDSYLLKIVAKDTEHLSHILKNDLGKHKNIKSTKTTLILNSVKNSHHVPFNEL